MSENVSRKEKYENFIKMIKDSGVNYDIDKISRAYKLCEQAHEGQFRSSGEPFFYHPVAVATICLSLAWTVTRFRRRYCTTLSRIPT